MSHPLDLDVIRRELEEPYPSGRMNLRELGEGLAQLVWESFSDTITDPEYQSFLSGLGIQFEGGIPNERAAEELLILHIWAHSRAVQLSFYRRVSPAEIRAGLDHLHRAVFEDMVENGTPRSQIPVFEQRVSARYAEYYAAARRSSHAVGAVTLEYLADTSEQASAGAARVLTERAVEIIQPLRDFLDGVELVAE